MRGLTRSAAIGILILSCADDITGPPSDYCSGPDKLALYPDSVQLVMGSADQVWLQGCGTVHPGAEIEWTIRDLSVASFGTDPSNPIGPSEPRRIIAPQAPGHTFLIVETDGLVDSLAVFVPDTVVMGAATHIAAGGDASCAVTDDETAWCWGDGTVLGKWPGDRSIGTCWGSACSPMPVPRKDGAHSVYTGGSHACSLDRAGGAWCWGENHSGQLGESTPGPSSDPVAVTGGGTYTALTLGRAHTCGLASSGAAYCWGDSNAGRLGGNQRSGPVSTPELVAGGHEFVSLDAREETTCGATDDGHLYCWGVLSSSPWTVPGAESCEFTGSKGGSYTVGCSYAPLRMPMELGRAGDTLFVEVSGVCALTALGSVFCYDDARGVYAPLVGIGPMAAIDGGTEHACALNATGSAWCWGSNEKGQLGDGTWRFGYSPVAVVGGHSFLQISVGNRHSCGLTTANEVWCWGDGALGQAGRSILTHPLVPVKIRGQG